MKIVKDRVTLEELKTLAHDQFVNVIKAVVDVKQEILAIGGEFHSDLETLLVDEENSLRENTWGINLRLDKTGEAFVEFDSMINLKPTGGNLTRNIENPTIREAVIKIVGKIVKQ